MVDGRYIRALFILGVLLSACVQGPEDLELSPDEPVPDDTVFHEVSVSAGPDGIVVSEPRPITAGEQRAQNQVKAALARGEHAPAGITLDSSCSATSFWLYDRTDWTGNRICFANAGALSLATYIRWNFGIVMNWEVKRGSYWAGNRSGYLDGDNVASVEYCGGKYQVCHSKQLTCSPAGSCRMLFSGYEQAYFDLTNVLKRLSLN